MFHAISSGNRYLGKNDHLFPSLYFFLLAMYDTSEKNLLMQFFQNNQLNSRLQSLIKYCICLLQKMDEYNVCPICFDTFTYPKILQCGHTFCSQCLKDFVDDKSTRKNFLCPLCRAKWKIPQKGLSVLPTNYFVGVSKLKHHEKYCLHCNKIGETFSCCST